MNLLSKFIKLSLIILPTAVFGYLFTPAGELTKADVLAGGILGLFKLNVTFSAWAAWIIGIALIYTGWTFAGNTKNRTESLTKSSPDKDIQKFELSQSQTRLVKYFKNHNNDLELASDIAKKLQVKEIEIQHDLNELETSEYIYCNYSAYGTAYNLTKKGVAYAVKNID